MTPLPFSFPPITVHSPLTLIRRLSGIEPDPTKPQPVALPYKLESPSYLTPNDKRNEAGNWKVKLCGASRLKPRSAYRPLARRDKRRCFPRGKEETLLSSLLSTRKGETVARRFALEETLRSSLLSTWKEVTVFPTFVPGPPRFARVVCFAQCLFPALCPLISACFAQHRSGGQSRSL